MALQPVKLDDLDWKGMVESIRRRIPAASDGHWTLHAPVDPGVTLLELFAWQLEQRLYWMDQVPDALSRAELALLGARPARTGCAVTVLQPWPDPPAPPAFGASLPRRTEFELVGSEPPVVFSTLTPLTPLRLKPQKGLRIWIGEQERTRDLEEGRIFRLFPADGGKASLRIELDLEQPLPASPNRGWFNLFVRLRTSGAIAPQWSAEAAHGVPPPAQLVWSYRGTDGALHRFALPDIDDGTGGLRRSGVVRIRIPADWQPEGAPGSGRESVYAIRLQTDKTSFAYPPRLTALVPNAVLARHARATRLHGIAARDWLPLPGNFIELRELPQDDPRKDIPPLESGFLLWVRERDGGWHRWRPSADFYRHGPADRVFVVDRERSAIRFGDGLTGRLPVLAAVAAGSFNIKLRYLVGGGTAGIVGESPAGERNWQGPGSWTARSLTASEGAAEPETLAQARQRAAASLRIPTRAVTKADYEEIARSTPGAGVRRAFAAVGRHPGNPCTPVPGAVTVFIVPDAPREEVDPDQVEDAHVAAPMPDPGALTAVGARLERMRLVTSEVFVRAPNYRPVALRVALQGDPADASSLQRRIADRLSRFLDPLIGGADADGWPFGEPLRPSVLLREAQAAVDKDAKVVEVAIGVDEEEPSESCRDIAIGACDLVWLKRLAVLLDRKLAVAGGLR